MSTKENTPDKEEEVDLGQLFKLIGNMFTNLFNFIGSIFKNIFHLFILLLIFIKKHFLKFTIASIIGGVLGFSIDFTNPKIYGYDMIIQPNYNSTTQIFENVEYYNVLIKNKDFATLSKKFEISIETSKNLKEFELIPYETEKDQLLEYDGFIKETDSATHKGFSFKDFKNIKKSEFEYRFYIYRIKSNQNTLKSFENVIISDIEKNPTLKRRKRILLNVLKLDSIGTIKAIEDLDALRSQYEKVALFDLNNKETTKGTTTYIDMSKDENRNNDIELFTISTSLNKNLIKIETKKEKLAEIVNIVSTFNPAGKTITTISDSRVFLLAALFLGLTLLFILIQELNKYITNYK